MTYPQSEGEFVKRNNGRVTMASLETTNVLLAEARDLGELFLGQAPFLSKSPNIQADHSAHIHAQRSADHIL
jgi:hypothetical protein